MTKKKTDNRIKLLDVAEELFADHGYHGVSVRDITDRAEVRLASINYYFQSKENLFQEVIGRRAQEINSKREVELADVDYSVTEPAVILRQIVTAFIYPIFERNMNGGTGWRNYSRLIAQASSLRSSVTDDVARSLNPTARKFIASFQRCYPSMDDRNAHYCFQLMLGSMLNVFAGNNRLEELSDGRWSSEQDLPSIYEHLLDFSVGGIVSLMKQQEDKA